MKNDRFAERVFYHCDCGSEGLVVDYVTQKDETLDIYFWDIGNKNSNRKLSLKDKFRHIWRILVTGVPYADMVMLPKDEVLKMAKDIIKFYKPRKVKGINAGVTFTVMQSPEDVKAVMGEPEKGTGE